MASKSNTMRNCRRSSMLAFFIVLAFPYVDGKVVPRTASERSAAATRSVEFPRHQLLPDGHRAAAAAVTDDNSHNDPRHLAENNHDHSRQHEKLSTPYTGTIPSSSLEFTLENHREDGDHAIISGLGLNVQIVVAQNDADETTDGEPGATPCRFEMYTKRVEEGTTDSSATPIVTEYELAMNAQVFCAGEGKETLLSSELFLRNYREEEGDDVPSTSDGNRKLLDTEDMKGGTITGTKYADVLADSSYVYGLSEEEKKYPLLIPPNGTLSVYIVVSSVEDTPDGISFLLLSSDGTDIQVEQGDTPTEGGSQIATLYKATTSLNLYTGTSIINGYQDGAVDLDTVLGVTSPTIFNGAIYYDTFDGRYMALGEYYDELQYSLLPGDILHGIPGCDKRMDTGYVDTIGSYGIMFDVSSAIPVEYEQEDEGFEVSNFRNVEIYSMDLYIRNPVNATFEIYIRKNTNNSTSTRTPRYTSYMAPVGQTSISKNWDLIAEGMVPGQGPDVGSPLPRHSWKRNVVISPGETVGFYVSVMGAPDLRYRNSTAKEGDVYSSDGVLNVGVGRSWGEYPLRGDGSDVYFAPREFAGGFHYHVHEGLCKSTMPSGAPTWSHDTHAPSSSIMPTTEIGHSYANKAEEEGLCEQEDKLETTFEDGTGSYGALFDVLSKADVVLTGIDLSIDWTTGSSAHVLIYARQGSWFGHQNNFLSWPLLLANTTISRPSNFHNRSIDGPYIPIDTKRTSAIIPRKAFTSLEMKMGETWSLYVCTSLADVRYTMGTSIGKTFASSPELRIMEGAGAADYPPFQGGSPETGGVEYTFYAPRVFNGNLRYDYVAECPSEAPSAVDSTPSPTVTPSLSTTVSYTFYVEHSSEILKGAVTYDMSFGVRAVLDRFLRGEEDLLYGIALNDELVIERVVANMVSPMEIGYLCYPTPPQICTPISVDVTATHRSTATTDEVTFALLRQSIHLPSLIDVEGYTIEYVGDRAVETTSEITLTGVPDREMGEDEQEFFENAARKFLEGQVQLPGDGSSNDSLIILSVTVNGQEVTSSGGVSYAIDDGTLPPSSSSSARNTPQHNTRRQLKKSTNIQVSVKGKYRPPPEVDFGEVVEDSINQDRALLQKELKKPHPSMQENGDAGVGDGYFEAIEVVGAREIKEEVPLAKKKPAMLGATTQNNGNDDMKGLLNMVAMAMGGLIGLLSLAFFLRPHRRRAIFSSGSVDTRGHRNTQLVNQEDHNASLMMKSRRMIHGGESETLGDSGNSFPGASGFDNKAAFDPRSSGNSLNPKSQRFSEVSGTGQPPGLDPRGSGTSLALVSSTRGSGQPLRPNPGVPGGERMSFRGGPNNPPPGFDINSSDRSGRSQSARGGAPSFAIEPHRNNSIPPGRHSHIPPNDNFRNSMPPVRRGGPPSGGMVMHQSMRAESDPSRMQGQVQPHRNQMQDSRRNQSMRPEHHNVYR